MNDTLPLTEQEWQRQAAVDAFNLTRRLRDKADRSSAETDHMIHAAHTSRFHWQSAGDVVNWLRSDWLLAHVYLLLDQPQLAVRFAQLGLPQCEDQQIGDFDLAFAYEGVARAWARQGNRGEAEKFDRLAEAAGHRIAETEDRELFFADLRKPPWQGLK